MVIVKNIETGKVTRCAGVYRNSQGYMIDVLNTHEYPEIFKKSGDVFKELFQEQFMPRFLSSNYKVIAV